MPPARGSRRGIPAPGLLPILDVVTKHVAAIKLYEHEGWVRVRRVNTKTEAFLVCGPLPAGA
jgi:hypothetical protein